MSEPVSGDAWWRTPDSTRSRPDMRDRGRALPALRYSAFVAAGIAAVVGAATVSSAWLLAGLDMLVLGIATQRVARRLATWDQDSRTADLVMAGLGAKFFGCLLRLLLTNVFYAGIADADEYHGWGKLLAPHYRVLNFSDDVGQLSGTGFMRALTGVVYSIAGTSKPGGYVIFGWLAFMGALLLWRAFRRAVPAGDQFRYACLMLFLPSLVYWPSALGKDAWAVFCLGLISYGVARSVTRGWVTGPLVSLAGLVGVGLLRPHIALTAFIGMVLAAGVSRSRQASATSPLLRIVVFGLLFLVGTVLLGRTSQFFGVSSLNQETVAKTLADAQDRTSEAGSQFTPVDVTRNPANFPIAVVTVLVRPFPFEVANAQSALSAAEGVFLVWLTWRSRRRLASTWSQIRATPYVAYSVGVVLSFIYAFSAFSNFGILARQRVQVLPFFLVLLCLPERVRARDEAASEADPSDDAARREPAVLEDPYTRNSRDAGTATDPYAAYREAVQREDGAR